MIYMNTCSWLEGPESKRLINESNEDKHELLSMTREQKIEHMAELRTASLNAIAEAIAKNNNQNVTDAIYYLAEGLHELAAALRETRKEVVTHGP